MNFLSLASHVETCVVLSLLFHLRFVAFAKLERNQQAQEASSFAMRQLTEMTLGELKFPLGELQQHLLELRDRLQKYVSDDEQAALNRMLEQCQAMKVLLDELRLVARI